MGKKDWHQNEENSYESDIEDKDSYLRNLVKSSSKKQISVIAILVIIVALIILASSSYIKKVQKGPIEIDVIDITERKMKTDNYYTFEANIEDQYLFETAYLVDDVVTKYYCGIYGNDIYIIVEFPDLINDDLPKSYTGKFVEMESELYEMILSEFRESGFTEEEIEAMVFPYKLKVGTGKGSYYLIIVALFILALLILYNGRQWLRNRDFSNSSIFHQLIRMGNPLEIEEEIQKAIENQQFKDIGKVRIVSHYIFATRGSRTKVYYLPDIQWCYKNIVTHKRYFITVGKSYSLTLCTKMKKKNMLPMKENYVNDCIDYLSIVHKGCLYGFSKETETLWKKQDSSFLEWLDQLANPKEYQGRSGIYTHEE